MDTTTLPLVVLEEDEVTSDDDVECDVGGVESECCVAQTSTDSLDDDGWETDIEIAEPPKRYDPSGRQMYVSACCLVGVTPVSYFLRHIQDKKIRLRHHSLGAKATKAMAIALVTNTAVISLDLHDNYMGDEGAKAIAEMLKENCFILKCDLSFNKIGSLGCAAMCDMLQTGGDITELNLSGNLLRDKDAVLIAEAIKMNEQLHALNLSHNQFSEKGGQVIGPSLASNDSIENLDLSWNHIRRQGAVAVATGLKTNCTLKVLDLSWNGLGDEGATALCDALKGNNTLISLNIRNNRISSTGAALIARGLENNNTLEVLKVGLNPIETTGAHSILSAIRNRADSSINEVDFEGVYLDDDFFVLLRGLNERKPVKVTGQPRPSQKTPLFHVKRFISDNYDRWMAEFEASDPEGTGFVSKEQFVKGLEKLEFNFNKEQLAWLCNCTTIAEDKGTKLSYKTPFAHLKKKPVAENDDIPDEESDKKGAKDKAQKKK